MAKLTEEELGRLKSVHESYDETKSRIGDLEISKHRLIKQMDSLETVMGELDKELSEKYGKGISINSGTGEIIKKEQNV